MYHQIIQKLCFYDFTWLTCKLVLCGKILLVELEGFFISLMPQITIDQYVLDGVYLQSGLEESSFNPLRGKQIDHPHVYFKKSHDSLKMSCD